MKRIGWGKKGIVMLLLGLVLLTPQAGLMAWSEHPLITYPVIAAMPEVAAAGSVKVETIGAFLSAGGEKLEQLLFAEEAWAKENLQWYPPLPNSLAFKADSNPDTAFERFCQAIRVNPRGKFPLYIQLLPGETAAGRPPLRPSAISFLTDTDDWRDTGFVSLKAGETVRPLEVVVSATDEPDLLGLDIGLFEDNKTGFGRVYGLGIQPFGNPNLEYGSQAPFHMGFYHESRIVYFFAGFLKKTLPEYRIRLYRRLAQFAFETGHPYWGWRFTGWGLHYLADLAQPYHAKPLPGVGTARALGINMTDLIGIRGPKRDAVQLVSNRHTALERFAQVVLQRAYRSGDFNHPILVGLAGAVDAEPYSDRVLRDVVARLAHEKAAETDRLLEETMPKKFVTDPAFELGTSAERRQIVEIMEAERGPQAVERPTLLVRELLLPFAAQGRGYVRAVLRRDGETVPERP